MQNLEEARIIKVVSREVYRDEHDLKAGYEPLVKVGDWVEMNQTLAEAEGLAPIVARLSGSVEQVGNRIVVVAEEREEREYRVPSASRIRVENGQTVTAGDQLTEGHKSPEEVLRIQGREAVQRYLVDEVQEVYRSQGVNINDKHIEIIARQMLRKLRVDQPGDTELLPGELVDRFEFEDKNRHVLAEGGEPATAQPVLLGVTKASLNTESFLAAASFQETTKVLTEAALSGKVDKLLGLKENVIIGKLIPAGLQGSARGAAAGAQPAAGGDIFLGEGGLIIDGDGPTLTPLEGGLDADTVLSDLPGFDDDDDDNGAATAEIISLMGLALAGDRRPEADVETESDGDDAPLALADLDLGDIDDTDLGAIEIEDEERPRS